MLQEWGLHSSVKQLWNSYREENLDAPADVPISFHFCDNAKSADLCADLVVAGLKRATAVSLAELELSSAPVPRAGDYAVVTNWAGEAKAIIRTTSVEIRRFNEVDEGFAAAEGEGDGTLDWWRSAHRAYFQRALAGSSYVVDDDLEIACEHFEVLLTA